MKDYKYLFDKNIEINLTANDNSINFKDNANITSVNKNFKSPYNFNLLLPSYNPHQYKDEKSSSLINKFLNKKEDFFKEKSESNENKLSKINSKYSTCNNYYPRKNYNKFLNSQQKTNLSIINNPNIYQQNTTFEGNLGYIKLNTRDLIEITKRRKEIIEQKKIKDEEMHKEIENNLNNLENVDIVINKNLNLNDYGAEGKNFCDEGVQTSLMNINEQEIENNNKKEEPLSTIIFTDKSALINQEITFLSIQYSLKNNDNDESKEYKCGENDFVNIGCDIKESIHKEKNLVKDKDKINNKSDINKNKNSNKKNYKNSVTENNTNKEIFDTDIINKTEDINNDKINKITNESNDVNKNINNFEEINKNINNLENTNKNINNFEDNNKDKDKELEFTIESNTQTSPFKNINEDEYYITNGVENFQIESNDKISEIKNNNDDNNNFTITNNINNNQTIKENNKILDDSLEESNENDNNYNPININNTNKSKSSNTEEIDENEITEVEEYDQNLIFLQNESKTMSSHFDNIRKKNNNEESDENLLNNKDNILIEDSFNKNNNNYNCNESLDNDNIGNCSETLDMEKNESLNNNISSTSLNKNKDNKEKNIKNINNNNINEINDIYSTDINKVSYKENMFRLKGRKNNSLNKYNDYPTLRNININENNSLKSKLFNNNYTNNNRYLNKNINFDEKDNNEGFDLLKLKTADLKLNNQDEKIIIKSLKNSNNNNYKQNTDMTNNQNSNIKFFSHKKLNININNNNNNNNNKNNISGIPKKPNKKANSNFEINNNINNNKAIMNKNYLITPRCVKKKRQLNNYVEYYKLKISMCKDESISYSNHNNEYNKNYKSLGHKKSTDNFNK